MVVCTHACVLYFWMPQHIFDLLLTLQADYHREHDEEEAKLTERQIQIQVKVLLTERILICAGVGQIRCGPVLNAAAAWWGTRLNWARKVRDLYLGTDLNHTVGFSVFFLLFPPNQSSLPYSSSSRLLIFIPLFPPSSLSSPSFRLLLLYLFLSFPLTIGSEFWCVCKSSWRT